MDEFGFAEGHLARLRVGVGQALPFAAVADVLGKGETATERCRIEAIDEESRLLKLLFDEEGGGDFRAPAARACRIRAAEIKLVRPVGETARVRLAVEKIQILTTDEDLRIINRVGCGRCDLLPDGLEFV